MFIEKFSELKFFHRICESTRGALCRFPLAMLFFVFMGAVCIDAAFRLRLIDKALQPQLMVYFLLAGLLATIIQVLFEMNGLSRKEKYLALASAYLILTSVYFLQVVYFYQVWGLTFFFLAVFFAIGGFSRSLTENDAWLFYYKFLQGVFLGLLLAALASFVLYMMGYTLRMLFDIRIYALFKGKFVYSFVIAIAPVCILALIPQGVSGENRSDHLLSGLKFSLEYILLPLLFLYAIVLHLTVAKVVFSFWHDFAFSFALDRGIGRPIAAFFVMGLLSYAAAYYFKETGTRVLRFYLKYFFKICFVPLIFFCVAVWMRIDEHGVTPARYLAAIAALSMLVLVVWEGFFRKQWRLSVIPAVVAVAALVYSVGPFHAARVSFASQKAGLEKLLKDYNVMDPETGEVRTREKPFITTKHDRDLLGKVDFFGRYNAFEEIREWVEPVKAEDKELEEILKKGKLCSRNRIFRGRFVEDRECAVRNEGGRDIDSRRITKAWGLWPQYDRPQRPSEKNVGVPRNYHGLYVQAAKGYDYIAEVRVTFNDINKIYDRMAIYTGLETDIKTYHLIKRGDDGFGVKILVKPEGYIGMKSGQGDPVWASVRDLFTTYDEEVRDARGISQDVSHRKFEIYFNYKKALIISFDGPDFKGEMEIERFRYVEPKELSGEVVILGAEGIVRFSKIPQSVTP